MDVDNTCFLQYVSVCIVQNKSKTLFNPSLLNPIVATLITNPKEKKENK